MKKIILFVGLMLCMTALQAQNTLRVKVLDEHEQEALPGATISLRNLNLSVATDAQGVAVFANLAAGTYPLQISYVGYETLRQSVTITADTELEFEMEHDHESMEEVVIRSTRSTRTIASIPTRVEFIGGEELEEKVNMRPGDIRFVLNESTGIITQITSPLSANASIRIQGLDGRYTQLLKDGFPLYSGAAGGLGLLQIPPLDLKQVEVIKGSSSTLYGAGAIAGMVNLISRTPEEEAELEFLINGTTGRGLDVSGFYGKKEGKFGITTYAALNRNQAFDPSDVGLTAIPEFSRITLNPRLFYDPSDKTSIVLGLNTNFEERTGGELRFFEQAGNPGFFERNITDRVSSQFQLQHRFDDERILTVKNSLNQFNRVLSVPNYRFDGGQFSSFSEINYHSGNDKSEWIVGANVWTEHFKENGATAGAGRDYDVNTIGVFVQNMTEISETFILESGLRWDAVQDYGNALLPRLSMLFKPSARFSSRIGGGLGYKAPTLFTEEAEMRRYQGIRAPNADFNVLERSYGFNWDVDYKTSIGDVLSFTINQMFFYTYIDNPLRLEPIFANNAPIGAYRLINSTGHVDTRGWETNMNIGYDHLRWVLGYTYTDARQVLNGERSENPLTPKHRINSVLMYEKHGEFRVGFESYYYSSQLLGDGLRGQDYWLLGIMAEKSWDKFSVFINFENFLDVRQTRFDTIYNGPVSNPTFRDIYAPLEGFIINGGVKVSVF
jgi:iron complex outermembrane receptor protein